MLNFARAFDRPSRSRYETAWRRDLMILLSVGALAAFFAAATPAHSQSTIFLTDRNGQVPFPILPPNRATGGPGFIDNMTIGATTPRPGTFTTISNTGGGAVTADSITGTDSSLGITGQAAAQGGAIVQTGGTSSTTGNAGGAVSNIGGTPGATGVGGAAVLRGGIGGATSGAGGAASVAGGAGTAGNSTGGAASIVGGAGQGTASGAAVSVTGGASGAGATGNGARANIAGGAALSTDGNGGSVVVTGGVNTGSGVAGMIIKRSIELVAQGAPAAATTSATLTAANVLTGIITVNQGGAGASAQQLPEAAAMDTAMPDAAAGDAFDFSVINISTVTAEVATLTTNTGWTLVGAMDVLAKEAGTKSAGRFRARKTGAGAWTLYRIS